MDILKRSLAPMTDESWEEIDDAAREILETKLTGRKLVDTLGPKGWDYSAIPNGRLDLKEESPEKVRYGIREVSPIVETRVSFKLNIWELDNLTRGAKDVDLEPLENAAERAAEFEEDVLYHGLEKSDIEGLVRAAKTTIDHSDDIPGAVTEAVMTLQDRAIGGPYNLVADKETWQIIARNSNGYPLKKQLEELIGGEILYSPRIESPLLVTARGGDFELSLGQDFSIGYENHDTKEVKLFITESFGFRILEPAGIVKFES